MTKQQTWDAMKTLPLSERNCKNCVNNIPHNPECRICVDVTYRECASQAKWAFECANSRWKYNK